MERWFCEHTNCTKKKKNWSWNLLEQQAIVWSCDGARSWKEKTVIIHWGQ